MIGLLLKFTLRPGTVDEFSSALQRQADFARDNESECLRFDAFVSPDDDNIIYLYEAFENITALNTHRGLDAYKALDEIRQRCIESTELLVKPSSKIAATSLGG